jgi:heptosyltransferase-2
MVDRCAALALPSAAKLPPQWPAPQLKVPAAGIAAWRSRRGLPADGRPVVALAPGAVGPSKRWPRRSRRGLPADGRPVVALAPGAVGPSKRWPSAAYAALTRRLTDDGATVWVLGGPTEKSLAAEIVGATPARDLTGPDLRDAILALGAATAAVSNDSGLLHVAAAQGTPSIGIFGPTSPWHWAPVNPLAATIETGNKLPCRPCHKPVCRPGHHLCMLEIGPEEVLAAARRIIGERPGAAHEHKV